jgi:hypothetical protein
MQPLALRRELFPSSRQPRPTVGEVLAGVLVSAQIRSIEVHEPHVGIELVAACVPNKQQG